MNKSKLKTYAPQARKDFIAAVTARANLLGLSDSGGKLEVAIGERKGDIAIIAGQEWSAKVYELRERLIKRMTTEGFSHTVDAIAYTWFNRFAALRYMEIHDYLDHGYRALSNREGGMPEILHHATELDLPGLNKDRAVELKLAGDKDGELYKMLLVAQCNALSRSMPFLFEHIDDETELLLPDNLLRTDSVIAKLVASIPEEDWQEVEIIGWLYQFYISEKKDEVIGKVVKSEDIPAATQLFTPNWIVKYLVQNSVGRLWLMANPASTLKSQWAYYIEPAEQMSEVQAQLDALIRARCLEGVVSDQWLVNSGGCDGNSALSGIDRLAEGNGFSGTSVSSQQGIPEGGDLRAYQSGATGSSVDTVQHRGGASAQINGGIQQFSFDSSGIEGGSRDSNFDSRSPTVFNSGAICADAFAVGRNFENARHLADTSALVVSDQWTVSSEKQFSDHSPLTTDHFFPPTTPPLNPESITMIDPACGSGHILVEAYEVLKGIYLERGYRLRDIPRLILEKNLYGLDIDDRAAQMAGFALLMKARADDRRLFTATDDAGNLQPPMLNVLSLQESKGLSVDELATHLTPFKVQRATITALVDTFQHAKTFGSLIQIPYALKTHLAVLPQVLALVKQSGDMYASAAADDLLPLVQQAQVLAMQFDAVVANPPYMGNKGMNAELKDFARETFPDSKSDLFAMFIERGFGWCKVAGFNCMVTMQSWMFLSSYEAMRTKLLQNRTIQTMAHLGARAFGEISGEVVQTTAFVLQSSHLPIFKPTFFRLVDGQEVEKDLALRSGSNRFDSTMQDDFQKVPGSPIAYWVTEQFRSIYDESELLSTIAHSLQGMITGNNNKFLRLWSEVCFERLALNKRSISQVNAASQYWIPYNKGGELRKWYGNNDFVLNWSEEGRDLTRARTQNVDYYLKPCVTWTFISSSFFAARFCPPGFLWDVAGSSAFPTDAKTLPIVLGLMCSKVGKEVLNASNPTVNFQVENILALPIHRNIYAQIGEITSTIDTLIMSSVSDWDSAETSWDFASLGWLKAASSLGLAWVQWEDKCKHQLYEMKALEEKNNSIFINAYGLQSELTPEVPEDQITLARADREKDSQRLISYAIGCMMGRYSLDRPGLIYAHSGNERFWEIYNGVDSGQWTVDSEQQTTDHSLLTTHHFLPDADGIVPLTDEFWFEDDAANRIREFLLAVWGAETLNENMAWLAESLGMKGNETPEETIRRYLAGSFFKNHLQTYKKRPIYWLFSSGKQGAFQALVYLHRYHEGTLARMRAEYVVPMTGKIQSRIEMLTKDAAVATVTAARNKINKEIDVLRKKHVELLAYDEKLRHYADMRIQLDLDDGVKVNYGKFGDLLAEVKAVTGGASDD